MEKLDYRVTLKHNDSNRTQDVVICAETPEQAGMWANRDNAGWTAQHTLTVLLSSLPYGDAEGKRVAEAEARLVELQDAQVIAEGGAKAASDAVAQQEQVVADARTTYETAVTRAKENEAAEADRIAAANEAEDARRNPIGGVIPQQNALREDGPTFEEYVAEGFPAENYPPTGYHAKASPGWTEYTNTHPEANRGDRLDQRQPAAVAVTQPVSPATNPVPPNSGTVPVGPGQPGQPVVPPPPPPPIR